MPKMELLTYILRPDNTAIWIPDDIAQALRVKRGDKLSPEQFGSPQVQALIAGRKGKAKP